jgi:hypothetical protein
MEDTPSQLSDHQIRETFLEVGRRLVSLEDWQAKATNAGAGEQRAGDGSLLADFIDRDQKATEAYNSIIMIVGYGALFTVWTQLKESIPPWYFFFTGLLALISTVLFVVYELLKTASSSHVNTKDYEDANEWYQARLKANGWVNRLWRFFFYPSVVAGVGSGLLLAGYLVWMCLKAALHWV